MATFTISGHNQVRDGYVGGTALAVFTWPTVGTTGKGAPTGTTARVALPAAATVGAAGAYRIACDVAVHIKFGDSNVNATTNDALMPAGFVESAIINDATVTHVAFITAA